MFVYQIVPGDFFTPDIWHLVIACIVEPTSIGFNMADVEVMTKLPEEVMFSCEISCGIDLCFCVFQY